ncbi:MAG TPA: MCE family protein [Mycobacterium sp.]|nr:MCE family protein [Mycobacterium sp.]HWT48238.1 MCE family protein [Mycobacterium sp.]
MRDHLGGAVWRLALFTAVCLAVIFALVAVFAQLRFQPADSYTAEFSNVSGLEEGNFVRIAGVEVGKVRKISINPDSTVAVKFSTDKSVVLTDGSRAVIRYDDLIGKRYLALLEGAPSARRLSPGQTIAIAHTAPALDLDALIGGFRPLFRALNADQMNALTGQLIRALQGEGPTIGSFLTQTATLTNTLADRDRLIGQVITNLNTSLGSLAGESKHLDAAIDALSQTMHILAGHKSEIANSVAYADTSAAVVADLLRQASAPFAGTVHQTDRVAALIAADREYFDDLLNTLPDAYQALSRQGIYGDFFSFYLCELVLKVNGKGGQPVYIRLANQPSGRCTPK